ncbi:hypothetical protein [Streptosporangium sp. KLBMP 9127]|nr:hypothetical protein [Streptosporangium sp. KLBMP 9127]
MGLPQREDELAALLLPEQARALWFLQNPPRTTGLEGGGILHRPDIDYISFEIACTATPETASCRGGNTSGRASPPLSTASTAGPCPPPHARPLPSRRW